MVQLTVNGKSYSVAEGTMLLEAVRSAGVDLPTLCYHEGLAPYGACRLCMVAIHQPRQALVAACTYPVEEGLEVETAAPEAVAARRLAFEFLLSRCPQSETIRELAVREGVTATRFGPPPPEQADELCMLCGLCVRVCREAIGAAAISFVGRGLARKVGTPFDGPSDACIGCGACAEVCPTPGTRRSNCRPAHGAAASSPPSPLRFYKRCSRKSRTCGRSAPPAAASERRSSGLSRPRSATGRVRQMRPTTEANCRIRAVLPGWSRRRPDRAARSA
jgi:bidirectional [NiFe] hydrogenase diaphorase subunit